ncbi:mannose-6-phosphate isomerase [Wolfiporia cocos MD-104 SS10]|uniref:Mannose-6-phosphate isomerase n=1 Tax=Wolfiporia cocos (strain MD-104) TaxID=742152 RepID=A0A2H3JS59_WOLCO|nr:mannose-6-phosphate isomerase [Wolfiporia cocos MD-104 SS10]
MTKSTTDAAPGSLCRLKAAVQKYPWGRTGSSSLAARLAPNAIGPDFKVDESESYAEIWMGTHPNGPAHLFSDPSISLHTLLQTSPSALLHTHTPSSAHAHVPFLFKILSIEKALPLQAHPDKALGARLRKEKPDLSPDPNHKPEIAVSIGRQLAGEEPGVAFTGFVGFRPLAEIVQSLEGVPELKHAVGDEDAVQAFVERPSKDALKKVYAALLNNGAAGNASKHVQALAERLKRSERSGVTDEQARLVIKAEGQYPGDVGALATTFFMNLFKLKRGEAVYIGADEAHAYLEGDIIECMAISDNVLNSAFSPPEEVKQQIPTFVDMLTYTARPVTHWALPAQPYQGSAHKRTTQYDPPLEEFVVMGTALREGAESRERLEKVNGPTIGIVTRGKVRFGVTEGGAEELVLEEGGVMYVVPGKTVEVELLSADKEGEGEVWWAACLT